MPSFCPFARVPSFVPLVIILIDVFIYHSVVLFSENISKICMYLYFTLFLKRMLLHFAFHSYQSSQYVDMLLISFLQLDSPPLWTYSIFIHHVGIDGFFSSLQSFALTNRTATSSTFTKVPLCFCHYVFGPISRGGLRLRERTHQQLCSRHCSRPLRSLSRLESPPALLESACIVTPSPEEYVVKMLDFYWFVGQEIVSQF